MHFVSAGKVTRRARQHIDRTRNQFSRAASGLGEMAEGFAYDTSDECLSFAHFPDLP